MNQQAQFALKRLNADLTELQKQPIGNVSALPLENNFFEWHCNIRMPEGTKWAGAVFHIALFFPENYPAKSPSAEFLPSFRFTGGATKQGKKGTQVCLSIFSDFGEYHPEWKNEKGTGWSPSYTTQTVLLNLVSFIMETSSGSGYYSYGSSSMEENVKLASGFTCKDCGHTHDKPYPEIAVEAAKPQIAELHESLTCYITKMNVSNADKNEVFGFGIAKGGNQYNPSFTSPCEYMTLSGFKSLKATNRVESVLREELHYFLPLFINEKHGVNIKKEFEASCSEITGQKFKPSIILNVLPKLLNSTVVTFMNGTTHTSERALHGYFAFHRLFLWAVQEYPVLLQEINDTITDFIKNPASRMKKVTPNVGEWLALLLVSDINWKEAATAYLEENFERNVMWYLKENGSLIQTSNADVNKTRLKETFRLTQVSRDLLAFQVLFLDVARPKELSLKEITSRYDNNYGVPTAAMETAMKDAVKRIKSIKDYKDWFSVIKVEYPGDDKFISWLCKSVDSAQTKDGYTFNNKGGGGGGRGGGRGGRGGGRGGRH